MRHAKNLVILWAVGLVVLSVLNCGDGQLIEVRTWQRILPPAPPNYKFVPFGETMDKPPLDDGATDQLTIMPKFWTLVPLKNPTTAATTLETTVQTTSTPPTTTKPTTTSTPCEYYDDTDLMDKLQKKGLYNAIYMATDVFTAANTFPDLGDRSFTMSNPTYECDQTCQRQVNLARRVMASKSRQSIHRPSDESLHRAQLRDPQITEAPRSWWRSNNWRRARGKRENKVDLLSRRRRSATELVATNSGKAENIIGTTIALQCDNATEEDVPNTGYHLCRNCRAIRQLSTDFFPRVLNEVICAEGDCLRGDGKCRQRFLPFKILKNFSDEHCPKWREVEINIRTCCDCVVHPNSPFFKVHFTTRLNKHVTLQRF